MGAPDTARGWMLMRDGGETLRASIRPTKDVKPWEPVITKYAELQIGLAEHVDEILKLGIPDHRLEALPALYTQLLTDEASLMIYQEKGLSCDDFKKLRNLTPRFEQICTDLAAYEIPASINHGDIHDGNVLLKNGRITFFDWGDADVTHPFVSLRTWFVSMEIALQLDDWAPVRRRRQHMRVGEAVEKAYARKIDDYVEALAYHFLEGNDLSKAIDYCHKAGDKAARLFAWDQARRYYETVLKLMEKRG